MINLVTIVGGKKQCRTIRSREEYIAACNTEENIRNWNDYRQTGNEKNKHKLVQINYNCQVADGGKLKDVKTVSPFFFYDIDCANHEECRRIIGLLMEKKEELDLVEVSESASYGVHAIGMRQKGTTILENQVRISMATKTEMDTNNKENNRVVFHGPINDETTPLLDERLFSEMLSDDDAAKEYELLKEREAQGLEQLPAGAKKSNKHYRPWEDDTITPLQHYSQKWENPQTGESSNATSKNDEADKMQKTGKVFTSDYQGIPYTEIIAKYWQLFNDGKEPQEGDRDTLTYQLACDLRHICGRNAEWLDQVIPCYDGFPLEEKRKKIESALAAKSEGMPFRIKQVLHALKSTTAIKACGGTLTTPPEMPKKLPPLVKLLTKNVPWFYKPAVAAAIFPALGAHLHGVKFRYWDNVDHEATFMNVLVGRQSIGKGTIKKPIEYIMEDIRQRDIPNRQREAEWKQKNPGARQKKDPRPTDICIQMLIDNLTDAVFNQRIVDANNNGERFLYTIVDEIDALKKVTSRGTVDEVGLLIRKAFDNAYAGQERVGADSVSGIAPLRWNFNASTTPPNARKFFNKMVNDGTVSRLDVSTIIRNDDNDDEAPILGIYDHQFAIELKPYIDRLEACNGLIECPQAKKLSLEMKQENSDAAKLYDSEAYSVLSYRANVIAWLKGMVLYVAHGYKWSKEIADFVRWSQQYNLWCKMLYFGEQLEKELREEVEIQKQNGPQNLLDLLPEEFSREQYLLMRQSKGRSNDGGNALRVWRNRGYIFLDEASGRYCKTEKYKKMKYKF